MDNIQAALPLPQMERLEVTWSKRWALARLYQEKLAGIPGLSWPQTAPGVKHAWHLFPVWIPGGRRDAVIQGLQERGIGVMVNYRAIHLLQYFPGPLGFRGRQFPNAPTSGDATKQLTHISSM